MNKQNVLNYIKSRKQSMHHTDDNESDLAPEVMDKGPVGGGLMHDSGLDESEAHEMNESALTEMLEENLGEGEGEKASEMLMTPEQMDEQERSVLESLYDDDNMNKPGLRGKIAASLQKGIADKAKPKK